MKMVTLKVKHGAVKFHQQQSADNDWQAGLRVLARIIARHDLKVKLGTATRQPEDGLNLSEKDNNDGIRHS